MSQLIAMFCDIDDFCKRFEPIYTPCLLPSGKPQRTRQTQLSLSEIMTLIVFFHQSHYRDFKHYYTEYVSVHLHPYFPALVSYHRFVELMPRAVVPLCNYPAVKDAVRASLLSIPPRWRSVTTNAACATESSTAMPRGASRRWGGILASNCI